MENSNEYQKIDIIGALVNDIDTVCAYMLDLDVDVYSAYVDSENNVEEHVADILSPIFDVMFSTSSDAEIVAIKSERENEFKDLRDRFLCLNIKT